MPDRILGAARQCFLAGGFGAVSMDAIAREAGVSKATLYAHFDSKEALFGEMIGRECARRFGAFSAGALDPLDLAGSLTDLGRHFLDLVLSPDAIAVHRIIIGEVTRFPELGEIFWRAGPGRVLAQMRSFLDAAVAAGSLAGIDTQRGAEHLLSLLRGEIHLRFLLRREEDRSPALLEPAVAEAVAFFLRGCGVDAGQAVSG